MGVPRYQGKFGAREAERLLWRAAFGPRPSEAGNLARKGLVGAVHSLTRPLGEPKLVGPAPHDQYGRPIAPFDASGHDILWWLDRMVRSSQPHVERMALIWHDWFATGEIDSQRLGVEQKVMFRKRGLGSFDDLLRATTIDPAMLLWLSGSENVKGAPNENYARELMELFTLGASDDTGYPYSEHDVTEQARALTGWTNDWDPNLGPVNFRFDPRLHDAGRKTILGKTGNWDWRDSCRLVLNHRAHAPYFVNRLWRHFIPTAPSKWTLDGLVALYKSSGRQIRPVVEAILMHPDLYEGQALVKPPLVFIVGLLKARKRYIDTDDWTWITLFAGQQPFHPPNVGGWDETRWLDTSTMRGRWTAVARIVEPNALSTNADAPNPSETPEQALDRALRYWSNPRLSASTREQLVGFGGRATAASPIDWEDGAYKGLRQNALRILVAVCPDRQVS